ncbi:Protein of unknown function DUF3511 [Cynara cardunculus var. scolymus]|uniref:DUF3511 domain-containing protein n=1 Tax=Cynara cardunculus var. scolymus TaxID=59895 RepID=A0A118JW07_CYNCS|nr:Protein of unknown function DUF3511 [Cynara cardunculus var. scolymus]
MQDFRSNSYNGNKMQIEPYSNNPHHHHHHHPSNIQDFRCHSASYASSSPSQTQIDNPTVVEIKKDSRAISRIWSLNDPELQRKKRIASYKAYSVEGKVKGSIKKSFRWVKDKYSKMVYGLRSS